MILNKEIKIKCKKILQFKWFHRLHILYIFGFVSNFRPSSPFFYEFLNVENSHKDIMHDIIPMLFYSTSAVLLPTFLLMEFLKFNPVIIVSSLTGIAASCLYIWGAYITEIQIAQAFYGCEIATEIAYFVSIYSHGDVKQFQLMTSYVRIAPLLAKSIASFLAQLLVYLEWLTYLDLYYFNLAAFIIATVTTIFLPPISPSDQPPDEKPKLPSDQPPSSCPKFHNPFPNKFVVKWTIWSILTQLGYNLFSIYVQPLWKHIQNAEKTFAYNGILEGLYNLAAAFGAFLGGYANFNWKFNGDLILSMTSLVEGFLLLLMSQITTVTLNGAFYVGLGFMYHFIGTILWAEMAKFLEKGSFGFIFGFIVLLGWTASSLVVGLNHFEIKLDNFPMVFMCFGFYHIGVSMLFIIVGLAYWFTKHTYE